VARREDGSRYDVRVTWFSGTFKLQFKDRGESRWDYDRKPSPEDWETFLDAIERRSQRKTATLKELEEARRLVAAIALSTGKRKADLGSEDNTA